MKTLKTIFIASAAISFASFASAQTEVPNTFVAGEAATAASVNANFDALITAIDSLGTRVSALEAGTSSANVTMQDLVGNNYCVSFLGSIGATNGDQNFARIGIFIGASKLNVTSTTQGTFTTSSDDEFELGWNLGFDEINAVTVLETSITDQFHEVGAAEPVTFNSFIDGVLNLTLGTGEDADTESFIVSPDGNMFTGTGYGFGTDGDTEGEAVVIIGMRCI